MTAIKTEDITFYVVYVLGGAGAVGLAPSVSVYNSTGIIVNGAGAVEVDAINAPGLYAYTLSAGLMPRSDMYVACFTVGAGADVLVQFQTIYVAPWAWETNADVNALISMLQHNPHIRRYMRTDQIEIKRSTDVSFAIAGLGDLTGRTQLYFTVKDMQTKDTAADAQSVLQIEESEGLLYINKNEADTPANGVLTVTDALAGDITIELAAVESDKIQPNEPYLYDIKMDNTVLGEGRFLVSTAITRTIL